MRTTSGGAGIEPPIVVVILPHSRMSHPMKSGPRVFLQRVQCMLLPRSMRWWPRAATSIAVELYSPVDAGRGSGDVRRRRDDFHGFDIPRFGLENGNPAEDAKTFGSHGFMVAVKGRRKLVLLAAFARSQVSEPVGDPGAVGGTTGDRFAVRDVRFNFANRDFGVGLSILAQVLVQDAPEVSVRATFINSLPRGVESFNAVLDVGSVHPDLGVHVLSLVEEHHNGPGLGTGDGLPTWNLTRYGSPLVVVRVVGGYGRNPRRDVSEFFANVFGRAGAVRGDHVRFAP